MKSTDYSARAAFLDTKLTPGMIGVEVGCDCGAHAQALLEYSAVAKLWIIDIWKNPWCEGYCMGRLSRWYNKVVPLKTTSTAAAARFKAGSFDFVYIDIEHDPITVTESLNDWWPLIKLGGVMGYRNYTSCKEAIDVWVVGKQFEIDGYHNEIIIWK